MFDKSARFYDAIYATRYDLSAKAAWVIGVLREHGRPRGRLLDAACGTGATIPHLEEHYDVVGLDLDPGMLAIARARCPDVPFHQADFTEFDLGEQFDVVLCLGGSIGYVRTVDRLRRAITAFARHTRPGGLVVVEPFLRPETWTPGHLHALFVDEPDLKIARMGASGPAIDRVCVLDFHYLVATPTGIEAFTEHHELGLFTVEEHLAAFRDAGLVATHDPVGFAEGGSRGLYLGIRPPTDPAGVDSMSDSPSSASPSARKSETSVWLGSAAL